MLLIIVDWQIEQLVLCQLLQLMNQLYNWSNATRRILRRHVLHTQKGEAKMSFCRQTALQKLSKCVGRPPARPLLRYL